MNIQTITTKQTSWAELKAAAQAGILNDVLHPGDLIPFNLKTGEEVAVRATPDTNGKWFFVFEDCLEETHAMNRRNTNCGGWKSSWMRKHLNGTVFALLPDDLQEIIAPTKIVQMLDGERVEVEDKLFLLSKTQIVGKGPWSDLEPEDAHLIYFKREKNRVKERGENGTWWYWLRTPYSGYTSYFCLVSNDGSYGNFNAYNSDGVAPGFCID